MKTTPFQVTDGKGFSLAKHGTRLEADTDKDDLKRAVEKDRARIAELQPRLYAERERVVLLIFQAMDAAGKDSCIAHVLSGVNPQGCQVWSFKAPSSEELGHDFLWRHAKAVPERGMIGVHNRSHYEEVLVTKVHPGFIVGQRIPGIRSEKDITASFWKDRYASIRAFEEHLSRQGVCIMKFYLHMGRDEQRKRFLERITDPEKNWKFGAGDVRERGLWNEYMRAYDEAIGATATVHAPWYIIPADEQWESRAIVCRLVRERLEQLDPQMPVLDAAGKQSLAEAAKALKAE
ncbi:MAG TPA: PPK2 family polyphosphate kinase [Flavobacteriales bacterium]|nr:PPK2 family polyphosphate kinase [Flavobacteriales bacterium]